MDKAETSGPLEGIRVLDLTLALAGPLCTQRLGDMGAEIIKIEGPTRGDFTRGAVMCDVRPGGETTTYLSLNRNKRSLAIDLKTRKGLALFLRLARDADVVIQNMRPGVAERLGIGYAAVQAVNPRAIYVSISGYGDEGPMVARPGQDLLVQCFSGTTLNAGTEGGLPHPSPIYIVDVAASHNACEAVLAGIIQRDRRGVGCEAKVSLLAAVLEVQIQELTTLMTTGHRGRRGKAPYASIWMEPPYGIYRTSDGFMALAQSDLAVIARVLGSAPLAALARGRPDPADESALREWRDSVYPVVQELLAVRRTDDAVEALDSAGVWCGPVQDYDDLIAHPQAAPLITSYEHARAGVITTLAPAIRFSTQHRPPMTGAPALGEHSDVILAEFGLPADEIATLRSEGVIA